MDGGILATAVASQVCRILVDATGIPDDLRKIASDSKFQRSLKTYIEDSLSSAIERYPVSEHLFFDERFVESKLPPLISQLISRSKRPTRAAVVADWQSEFERDVPQGTLRKMADVANYFLSELEDRLRDDASLQGLFDSIAFDNIAEDIKVIKHDLTSRKPNVRMYVFRQTQSFTLHDVPKPEPGQPALEVRTSPLVNPKISGVHKDIQTPAHIKRWKIRSEDDVLWHIVVDNAGDDVEENVSVTITATNSQLLRLAVERDDGEEIKEFEGGVSIGNSAHYIIHRIIPGKSYHAEIVSNNKQMPEFKIWCRTLGWRGPEFVSDIYYSLPDRGRATKS